MTNTTLLVGRLITGPTEKIIDGDKTITYITVSVDDLLEKDKKVLIDCIIWDDLTNNIRQYCHSGSIIGVRGRLGNVIIDGNNNTYVIVEKLTFLESKKESE